MDGGAGVRVYEDLAPPHKMVRTREPPMQTLSVDLSAQEYKRDHIKVQVRNSRQLLVVSGERPVEGNRWNRFRLEFQVPNGCDVKAIHAWIDNGVVRVAMPPPLPPTPEDQRCGDQFIPDWTKLATTLVGVAILFFTFGICLRYSIKP